MNGAIGGIVFKCIGNTALSGLNVRPATAKVSVIRSSFPSAMLDFCCGGVLTVPMEKVLLSFYDALFV